jgi:hypothetical protein
MPIESAITEFRLADNAQFEMARRQISEADIAQVLSVPEHMETVRPGRMVFQSRLESGDPGRGYLLRVFVDTDRPPPKVVTAYRTSRVEKSGSDGT